MNVGIVDVDSLIPNAALMRLAAIHRAQGDTVKLYEPLFDAPDVILASKVFDSTPEYEYFPAGCEIVRGGTGYGLDSHLPEGADAVYPAYDLFGCDYALGRITRGCVRRCPWCVVWRQDGKVRRVAELSDFLHDQDRVRLIDDNLTADADAFVETCAELTRRGVAAKWEALDARLLTVDMARSLAAVPRWGRVHFAWDSMKHEAGVRRGIANLKAGGFPLRAATFYVLVGFDTTPEEDMYRVRVPDELGVESFAMPYDKADAYQRRFARWVNAKPAFRSVPFDLYDVNARASHAPETMALPDAGAK